MPQGTGIRTIFKYNAIKQRMKEQPSDPYIGDFFAGFKNKLTKDQCREMIDIINSENAAAVAYIQRQMTSCDS